MKYFRNNNVFLFFKIDLVLQKLLRNISNTFDKRKDPPDWTIIYRERATRSTLKKKTNHSCEIDWSSW